MLLFALFLALTVRSEVYKVTENGDGFVRAGIHFKVTNDTENLLQLELSGPLIKWVYSEDESVESAYKERTLDADLKNVTVFTFANENWALDEEVTVPFNFTYDKTGESIYEITIMLNEDILLPSSQYSFKSDQPMKADPSGSVDEAFGETNETTTAAPTSEEEEVKVRGPHDTVFSDVKLSVNVTHFYRNTRILN